jgi:hypothetical protein
MPNSHPVYLMSEYHAALDVVQGLRPVPEGLTRQYVSAVEPRAQLRCGAAAGGLSVIICRRQIRPSGREG